MGRILSIDCGRKRCGIAVTDPLRIVATGLTTVRTVDLSDFLTQYFATESVDYIVIGQPQTMRGEPSESMRFITPIINRLRKLFPGMRIEFFDERFTSVLAHRAMIDSGMKRKDRQNKEAVDEMSATIILNDYLQSKSYNPPA